MTHLNFRTRTSTSHIIKLYIVGYSIYIYSHAGTIRYVSLSPCRDAEDAVYGRDGYDYDGYRLRVEFPRSGRGSGRGGGSGALGNPRGRYGPPSRRSEYRVVVSGA